MLRITIFFSLVIILCSCGGNTTVTRTKDSDTIITHAQYLSIIPHETFIEVTILNPWREGQTLGRYALVSERQSGEQSDKQSGEDVPKELTVLRVPLQRSIVYSSIHTSAIEELEATDRIVGVADGRYFTDNDPMKQRITSGVVTDIGANLSPSIEKIIDIEADALLLSPWENGNLGGVERSGVPLVFMADYLEQTPLGRAEWIKLIGYLYGKESVADSIFNKVCHEYERLKGLAVASSSPRPKVLTEKPYSGIWYVPGGESYVAKMIADAGGGHPWADNTSVGSLPLDEAAVIDRACDADIWLIKEENEISATSLLNTMPHAEAFTAFPNNVYVCNTRTTSFYRDLAFHPEHILADYIRIFHPEALPDYTLRYFQPLNQ